MRVGELKQTTTVYGMYNTHDWVLATSMHGIQDTNQDSDS